VRHRAAFSTEFEELTAVVSSCKTSMTFDPSSLFYQQTSAYTLLRLELPLPAHLSQSRAEAKCQPSRTARNVQQTRTSFLLTSWTCTCTPSSNQRIKTCIPVQRLVYLFVCTITTFVSIYCSIAKALTAVPDVPVFTFPRFNSPRKHKLASGSIVPTEASVVRACVVEVMRSGHSCDRCWPASFTG